MVLIINKQFFRIFLYSLFASIAALVFTIGTVLIFVFYFVDDKIKVINKSNSSKFSFIIKYGNKSKMLSPIGISKEKIYSFYPVEAMLTFKIQVDRGFAPINEQMKGTIGYGYGGSKNLVIFNNRIEITDITSCSKYINYFNGVYDFEVGNC